MAGTPHKKTWDEEMADLIRDSVSDGEIRPFKEPEPRLFKFWDLTHKYLFLVENKLVADVKTSNPEQLIAMLPNKSLDLGQNPMFMAPENKKSCLSCVKSVNGQYQIELKEKDIKELDKNPQNAKAFTFYSKSEGNGNTCTFESAEFPGWFISTSSEAKKPIGLSQKGGTQNIQFYFERKLLQNVASSEEMTGNESSDQGGYISRAMREKNKTRLPLKVAYVSLNKLIGDLAK